MTLFHRGKTRAELPDSVREINGDRRQLRDFREQFAELNPDVVIDMQAMVEEDGHALVETFRGVSKRLVLISSMDVYRVYGQLAGTEDLKEIEAGEVTLAQAQWKWTRGYVENVAEAIALATTDERASGRIYNVGEPNALTELEWAKAIALTAQWNGPITIDDNASQDEHDFRFHMKADTSRIRRELGFRETISLEEALRRSVEWERANTATPEG